MKGGVMTPHKLKKALKRAKAVQKRCNMRRNGTKLEKPKSDWWITPPEGKEEVFPGFITERNY